jgi:hypothetical protein
MILDRRAAALLRADSVPSPERFRAKWIPVRVKKTRQNKNWSPVLIQSEPESSRLYEEVT